MSDNTKIEWTNINGKRGATVNPIRARRKDNGKVGTCCVKVSPACTNCYAERQNKRNLPFGTGLPYTVEALNQVDVFCEDKVIEQVLRWREPRGIFLCSMTDLFGEFVSDADILRVFQMIGKCPRHTFFVLTKRSKRMREFLSARRWRNLGHSPAMGGDHYVAIIPGEHRGTDAEFLPNVILMVTAEDQQWADERIPDLLATPAACRGVSIEPMLGPVDLGAYLTADCPDCEGWAEDCERCAATGEIPQLDWVIAGGESGPGARPSHPDWFRDLQRQCAAAGTAYFFKQWGAWVSASEVAGDGPHHYFPDGATVMRVGKHSAGRLLDGLEYSEFPEVGANA